MNVDKYHTDSVSVSVRLNDIGHSLFWLMNRTHPYDNVSNSKMYDICVSQASLFDNDKFIEALNYGWLADWLKSNRTILYYPRRGSVCSVIETL